MLNQCGSLGRPHPYLIDHKGAAGLNDLIQHKGTAGLDLKFQCTGNGTLEIHRPYGITLLEDHMRYGALLGEHDLEGFVRWVHLFVLQKLLTGIVERDIVDNELCGKSGQGIS